MWLLQHRSHVLLEVMIFIARLHSNFVIDFYQSTRA